jgi:hypothetical protein
MKQIYRICNLVERLGETGGLSETEYNADQLFC